MQYSKNECYNSNLATGIFFADSDLVPIMFAEKNLYQPPFSSKTLRTLDLVLSHILKAFYKHTVTTLARSG